MSLTTPLHRQGYNRIESGEPYEPMAAPYFPSLAYREFLDAYPVTANRPYYASMAITSGGYKRDTDLEIGSVVAKNTNYGLLLRDYLADNNLGPEKVVIPSELGAMRQASWGQLDFLMLWYHVMSGVDQQDASRIENALRSQGVYRDAKWAQQDLLGESDDEKWQAYVQFTESYAAVLQDKTVTRYTHRPVKGVFGVLDGEMSLGGKAERLFAECMGVPFYTIEVQKNSVSDEFRQELETLKGMGARALQLSPEQGPRVIFRPVPHGTIVK